jgi:hypothetical protein
MTATFWPAPGVPGEPARPSPGTPGPAHPGPAHKREAMKAATVAGTVMAAVAAWVRRARVVRSVWAWWAVRAWSHRLRARPWDGEVCRWCAAPLGRQSAMCPAPDYRRDTPCSPGFLVSESESGTTVSHERARAHRPAEESRQARTAIERPAVCPDDPLPGRSERGTRRGRHRGGLRQRQRLRRGRGEPRSVSRAVPGSCPRSGATANQCLTPAHALSGRSPERLYKDALDARTPRHSYRGAELSDLALLPVPGSGGIRIEPPPVRAASLRACWQERKRSGGQDTSRPAG